MGDTQVQERVETGSGPAYRGVTGTTRTTADPVTGASTRRVSTRTWSARSPLVGIIGLLAAVVIALLALDFIFHATGAANVGSGAFIFSAGAFLASPFTGIFRITQASTGGVVVWADVMAIVVYAFVAGVISKLASMTAGGRAKRAV